jgi:hypothetical protein
VALLAKEGILRVDRAQAMLRLEVDPSRAIYLTDGVKSAAGAEEPGEEGAGEDGVLDATNGATNGNGA